MKILLIGTAWPYRGGLASFNERLIQEFIAEGHQAEIVTFTLQYPNFLFPGKTQYSDSPAPSIPMRRAVNAINPVNWYRVGRQILSERPDLVIIKYWMPFMAPCFGTIVRQIARNKHTKCICIADNIIPHERKLYDKPFTKYFIRAMDGFVVMSNSVMQDLALFDRKKLRAFNPHPLFDNFGASVDKAEACSHLKLDPQKKYVLFFGFIREYKGLDLLLEAFASIHADCHLIIAGEYYTDKQAYDKLIAKLEIGDRIHHFHHFIPDEEVKYYFCASDLVVQPYKHATQSGVTQIAYHFDVPMIVTNTGGLPEMVPDKKVGYVTAPDSGEIARAIDTFFQEGKSEYFQSNIREEKKRFSWSRMTKTILDVYQKIK